MKLILSLLVCVSTSAFAFPKYGAKVTRLYDDKAYIQAKPAPDFWALMPYSLPQFNGSACSVASVTTVLNGLQARQKQSKGESLLVQETVLKLLNDPAWNKGVLQGGGASLDELGDYLTRLLSKLNIQAKVDVVHMDDDGPEMAAKLRAALEQNEKSDDDFLIFNFLQKVFVGDLFGGGGHFSPVAAYDAVNRRVLILDVYRKDYEPYWIPEQTALDGMATRDSTSRRNRGYLHIRR